MHASTINIYLYRKDGFNAIKIRAMPINKDAMTRYKILDKCFRNTGRRYRIEDLIGECNKVMKEINPESKGISRRQIYNDISFMESSEGWGADILHERDGQCVYLRYADSGFSIDNMPLNDAEIKHLRSAIEVLSHFNGMPQFEWVQDTLSKIEMTAKPDSKSIIEFDHNPYVEGQEYLSKIYDAIVYHKVLSIDYCPFDMPERDIIFHPYYLKQSNKRWYALGYSPNDETHIWTLGIERIKRLSETSLKYKESDEDWSEYFSDIVGVTLPRDGNVEEIVIHAFGKTAKYIHSKPIHESQRAKWIDENTLEIKLNLIQNIEFLKILLSYGENIKIIRPQALVEKVVQSLKNSLKLYE